MPVETDTKSPVQIIKQGNKVTVEMASTGDVLAWCMIGDDVATEAIADLLSAKRLPLAAAKLRQMAMDARRPLGITGKTGKGQVGYINRP